MTFEPRTWSIQPKNASAEGIHDDTTAQRLGFRSAFVPGVTLYENLVVGLLEQDPQWLHHGRVEMNFRGPVYDGEVVRCSIIEGGDAWEVRGPEDARARGYGLLHFDGDPPEIPAGAPSPKTGKPLGDAVQVGTLMECEVEFSPERIRAAAEASGFYRMAPPEVVPVGLWTNPVDLLHGWFDSPTTIHYTSRIWHYSPLLVGEVRRSARESDRFFLCRSHGR